MNWETPTFEDINMSAEIGAYQQDDGGWDTVSGPPSATAGNAAADPA